MDRGAWQATVYGVAELDTPEQLSAHTQETKIPHAVQGGEKYKRNKNPNLALYVIF